MEIKLVALKKYTSIGIGGEAQMVIISSEEELIQAVKYAKVEGFRLHILGAGTNTVFGENLKNLLVIKNEIKGLVFEEVRDDNSCLITVGAGEIFDEVIKLTVDKNYWGLENLSHIPGMAGAAPVQNIGAYGVELKDILVSLRAYDLKTDAFVEFLNKDCHFAYRDSIFKHSAGRYLITSITLKLSTQTKTTLSYKPLDILLSLTKVTPQDVRELVIQTRGQKLPDYKLYPNAGSFFKNPVINQSQMESFKLKYPDLPIHQTENSYKIPAAWLIEHLAEMKGLRIGDIGTWPKQPLVVVNYGEATLEELLAFAESISNKVQELSGLTLESEVNLIK